jgi:hypothetical protein
LALIQSQPQQHQQQQTLSANPCFYYYTPISPAVTNAAMGQQAPQPQQQQQQQQQAQSQQFIQTQPAQSKPSAQQSQSINYLTHYGYVDPYATNANVPVIQPQAHAYYAANVPLAQYPQAGYYLNSQQFMSMALNQNSAANGLPQTSYQTYAYVQPQGQLQQSSNQMKPVVNTHVQQQRPPSAPHLYHHYQSRSNTPKTAVYADQYMMDPNTFGMASSSNTTSNRGGKMKYSHSNRVPGNQHRANNYQGHYAKANRINDMANKHMTAFVPPQNVMSNQQEGLVEQAPPN